MPTGAKTDRFLGKKSWISIALAIALLGAGATIVVGRFVASYEGKFLAAVAQTMAAGIDLRDFRNLSGSSADLSNPSYAAIKDELTKIRAVNPGARFTYLMGYREEKLFFYADSEPPDSSDYSAPGDIYTEASQEKIDHFLKGENFVEGPYKDRWGRWVSAYAPMFDSATGKAVAYVGIDISAKAWQEEIWYAQSLPVTSTIFILILLYLFYKFRMKEREVEKVKAELVSFATHQLRTPIGISRGYVDLLLEGKQSPAEQKESLMRIRGVNERLLGLVNAMLNASRVESGVIGIAPEPSHLPDLADEVAKEMLPQMDAKKFRLEKQYAGDLPPVSVDRELVGAIMRNLLSNAVKYTPEGGTITIKIEKRNENAVIAVSDTGMGIPKEQQSKMFTKFFRADNVQVKHTEGTGLGLYVVKSILEQSGGSISFQSEENKGTTFFVAIPLSGMKKREGTKGLT